MEASIRSSFVALSNRVTLALDVIRTFVDCRDFSGYAGEWMTWNQSEADESSRSQPARSYPALRLFKSISAPPFGPQTVRCPCLQYASSAAQHMNHATPYVRADDDKSRLHHKNVYGFDKPFSTEEKRQDGNYEMSWCAYLTITHRSLMPHGHAIQVFQAVH